MEFKIVHNCTKKKQKQNYFGFYNVLNEIQTEKSFYTLNEFSYNKWENILHFFDPVNRLLFDKTKTFYKGKFSFYKNIFNIFNFV